jgi:membrane protein DedA with SNARE-associated domain
MQEILTHLGYPALFLGTLVEGETFILVAGFLAHRGYFRLGVVILLATLGAFSGDILYFLAGRRFGRGLLERSPRARALVPWLERWMAKHQVLWIFGMRYLYGIRWLGAVLGSSTRAGDSRRSRFLVSRIELRSIGLWATRPVRC